MSPSDPQGYLVIEAARAGDEVDLAPGNYHYKVSLSAQNSGPVLIRAQDPNNPPVFDLTGLDLASAPGSDPTANGCWNVTGSHYRLFGITVVGCQKNSLNVYHGNDVQVTAWEIANGSRGVVASCTGLLLEHLYVHDITGRAIAIYGGDFTMRYSLVRDVGFALTSYAASGTVEYNWFARASQFMGSMSQCGTVCEHGDGTHFLQLAVFLSNVFVVGEPANVGQVIAVLRDEQNGFDSDDQSGVSDGVNILFAYNLVLGHSTGSHPSDEFFHGVNGDLTVNVLAQNNILLNIVEPLLVDDPGNSNYALAGNNNWLGTMTDGAGLTNSQVGDAPGFANGGGQDYRPASTSLLRGAAGTVDPQWAPTQEYYLNETNYSLRRVRTSGSDIGPYQFGTSGPGLGPEVPSLPPDLVEVDAGVGTPTPVKARSLAVGFGCSALPEEGLGCVVLAIGWWLGRLRTSAKAHRHGNSSSSMRSSSLKR